MFASFPNAALSASFHLSTQCFLAASFQLFMDERPTKPCMAQKVLEKPTKRTMGEWVQYCEKGMWSWWHVTTDTTTGFLGTAKHCVAQFFFLLAIATCTGWQEWEEANSYTLRVAKEIDQLEMTARAEPTKDLLQSLFDLCIQDAKTKG